MPRPLLAALLTLSLAGSALAHHGWSEYDAGREMTLSGTIVESGYDNPHGFVQLRAGDRLWRVILAPPMRMESRGLPRAGLRPGTVVTVVGYPHRRDASELRAERITIDGRITELR